MNNKRLIIFKTDENEIILPITPEEYEITESTDYKTVSIVSVGEVFVGGLSTAQTIKLMSFFPANRYNFSIDAGADPQKYIDAIETLQKNKTVFRLIISGTGINLPVRIHSFLYGEVDGSNDVEYQIILGVHRELETAEAAGWTIPKRKYDPPKSKKKSKSGKGNKYERSNTGPYTKRKTISGSSSMAWDNTTLSQEAQ